MIRALGKAIHVSTALERQSARREWGHRPHSRLSPPLEEAILFVEKRSSGLRSLSGHGREAGWQVWSLSLEARSCAPQRHPALLPEPPFNRLRAS